MSSLLRTFKRGIKKKNRKRIQIPNQSIYKLTYIYFFFRLPWERPSPARQHFHLCSASDRWPPPPHPLTLLSLPPFYPSVLKKLTSPFITHYLASILSFLHSHSSKKESMCSSMAPASLFPFTPHFAATAFASPTKSSDPSAMQSMGILSSYFTWPVATTITDTSFPCSKWW